MEIKPRSAKVEEFDKVTGLINYVFRISRNYKPTMVEEFPLLLNKDNIENMIIISENEKVVSDVNYLVQDVSIQGNKLKVAAIGGVCTHPDYEKKGYSSKILDKAEEKMFSDGVDVLIISGTRSLYSRRNCSVVKSFYKYTIKPENIEIPYEIVEFDETNFEKDADLDKMIELYNQNSTRFIRTRDEFKKLLHAATIAWGPIDYKKVFIKENSNIIGYLIIRTIKKEGSIIGEVVEIGVNNINVENVLKYVTNKFGLEYLDYKVHVRNLKDQLECNELKSLDYQQGTIKIINYSKLCDNLKGYFNQYVDSELLEHIEFKQVENKYIIKYKEEELMIESLDKLNKLFFERNEEQYNEFKHLKKIYEFTTKVFPIDFPWTANLNYQ
ncbi:MULTISPECIES: GNAT family N-acetyltransferase [unclassified Clostridioides]|uniref:GNAT family N-acetyltransferase n=1 Tax=unclassified Clostridioides TaxID=2635829 RepID=UPI001D0CBA4A|nr:GNAT family N-acetyltransferase [Clostridioides sp. ES-S-0049-03]MCC0653710.1 GNAT family N-acetyltransferase [Clostridioides sp. ES-S-0001-03]MCC0655389.1 GNAT family N-acetyltransferase [Clostridioides sp. ES-S-0123-01]MCC0674828.1 GNAT family N-acetyltransferase [Clostridioides sp. ES-W-0018-02]MCC0707048.1 GNAT family N-acetyltransferase [Clostridioides sp. ES-S-0190-01]MCC0710357.1 GNAT family N-acetyltransferase [Clostridioides sp. ES-W-0017-02]